MMVIYSKEYYSLRKEGVEKSAQEIIPLKIDAYHCIQRRG